MEYKIADHVRIRASLAVLVIDDYTNKIIGDSSIQVLMEDGVKPIRKSEGYFVFINVKQPRVHIIVKSERYDTQSRWIDLETLSKSEPIVKLRVKPNRYYPLQKGTTCLQGNAEPNSEIRVICDNMPKYLRLLYDYTIKENLDEIQLFNPEKIDLDGKIFQIKDKDGKSEIFGITGTKDRESNLYQMEKPLSGDFKKVGTKIYPVYVTKADELGEYFIPFWNLGDETINCQCEMLGDKNIKQSIALEIGKINKLKFLS